MGSATAGCGVTVVELMPEEPHLIDDVQAPPTATQITQHGTILMTRVAPHTADSSPAIGRTSDGAADVPRLRLIISTAVAIDDESGAVATDGAGVLEPMTLHTVGDTVNELEHGTAGDEPDLPDPEISGAPSLGLQLAASAAVANAGPAARIAALPAELRRYIHAKLSPAVEEVMPRQITKVVDLGWGIVVGELSRGDFDTILAFPVISDE